MRMILWISIAGVAGTLSRYYLGGVVQKVGWHFPWGTFAVNMLGCLLFGLVWSLAENRNLIGAEVRTALLIGFMGAFTTFSTFAFETTQRIVDGQWGQVAANLILQNVVGISLMLLGMRLGRLA